MAPIQDKMRGVRLRWFDHIRGKNMEALARKCERIILPECRRG